MRLLILIAAAAGIWVGVGYYIWQQQPSVQVCNQLKRELMLIEWTDEEDPPAQALRSLLREHELKGVIRDRC